MFAGTYENKYYLIKNQYQQIRNYTSMIIVSTSHYRAILFEFDTMIPLISILSIGSSLIERRLSDMAVTIG